MTSRSILVFALTAMFSVSSYAQVAAKPAQPREGKRAAKAAKLRPAGAKAMKAGQPRTDEQRAAAKAERRVARDARRAAKAHKAEVRSARLESRASEPLRPKDYSRDFQVPPGNALLGTALLTESFDTGIPAGWAVVDNAGSGVVWTNLVGCEEAGNFTGGAGEVACVSSDLFGQAEFDTELRTPVIDLTGFVAPASLTFLTNYQNFVNSDFFAVDVSTNGAAGPWTNLLNWNEDHGTFRGTPGEAVNLDIASVTGQANVMFRFHYFDPNTGDFDWYAQVDDVVVTATGGGGGCVLTCPADLVVATDPGLCSAVATYPPPTPTGQCAAVVCTPASGSSFNEGTTLVTCTESFPPVPPEGQGGPASCTFNVTVNDLEPPVLTCPADQQAELPPNQTTVPVVYPVLTVADNCPGSEEPACVPPSGSSFPAGTSPVACTVDDASGNSGGCGFDVIVGGGGSIIEIPTLSQAGLAGLALFLMGAAFVVLRRQR
jgi:hypothetical protein